MEQEVGQHHFVVALQHVCIHVIIQQHGLWTGRTLQYLRHYTTGYVMCGYKLQCILKVLESFLSKFVSVDYAYTLHAINQLVITNSQHRFNIISIL